MTAATIDSHQSLLKFGIWLSTIWMHAKIIMKGLFDVKHFAWCPCLCKQFDFFTALVKQTLIFYHTVQSLDIMLINILYFIRYIFTYTILIEAVIVYPIVTPTRFMYWANPHSWNFLPPTKTVNEKLYHKLKFLVGATCI